MDRTRFISQERIKTSFISQVLSDTASKIRAEQSQVVDEWNLFESGLLKSELQQHFDVKIESEAVKLTMRNVAYLRFLDIKNPRAKIVQAKREGYHLYNRITYGNLYGYFLRQIRFGLTDDIKAQISDLLAKSIE